MLDPTCLLFYSKINLFEAQETYLPYLGLLESIEYYAL